MTRFQRLVGISVVGFIVGGGMGAAVQAARSPSHVTIARATLAEGLKVVEASTATEPMNVFAAFQSRIARLIEKRIAAGELPRGLDLGRFVVEPPREAAHGDLSTNVAMVYAREAKEAGSNPRALAASLAASLQDLHAISLARQTQHELRKIAARGAQTARAEHARSTYDDRALQISLNIEFAGKLRKEGVLVSTSGKYRGRACLHLDVAAAQVDDALSVMKHVVNAG